MITHEEARKELEAFQKMIGLRLDKVEKYITQQEKKDKLLGLYRNLSMETDVIERSKYWEQINKIELEELK